MGLLAAERGCSSMDDYLFEKQQKLHSLNADFLAFLNVRENKTRTAFRKRLCCKNCAY